MFRKMFVRDYRYYQRKGEKALAEERYVDARDEFIDALQRLPRTEPDFVATVACIEEQMREAGNMLGEMNLIVQESTLNLPVTCQKT